MPSFTPPQGMDLPEGIQDGQAFEEIGTFVVSGGNIVLVKVGGKVVPGYEKMAQSLDRGESVTGPEDPHNEQEPGGDDFEEQVNSTYKEKGY